MPSRLQSKRGSSTARADAFARSEREEKASARFGRNDIIINGSAGMTRLHLGCGNNTHFSACASGQRKQTERLYRYKCEKRLLTRPR
jgi:hypothetical protein